MLRHEVLDVMTVEQWQNFLLYRKTLPAQVTIILPDGRVIEWYEEHDVHEFLTEEYKREAISEAGSSIQGDQPVVSVGVPQTNADRSQMGLFPNDHIG